jgi:valyl-tRNA synthetase
MIKKLPDRYDAKNCEKQWQEYWKKNQIYKFKNDKEKAETFVIDTPPPTVSGLLHMGHVFSYCQADFVARFQRMIGKDVFYPMGFDDNGLPTERLVEKVIGKKAGIFESENGQGSFVNKCREVVEGAEKEFEELFNAIALSVDWEQKYQTISPQSQKISQASFIDLYRKGLVEKKFEPVFWDISDRTALAQADLIDKEVEGVMNYIEFEVEDNIDCKTGSLTCKTGSLTPSSCLDQKHENRDGIRDPVLQNVLQGDCHSELDSEPREKIQIMTTRPELLPACVAVMINGDDERYSHLIKKDLENGEGFTGSYAITPLFGVKVPIICDELVQLDKGTGIVMCCTFGDETDIKWWKKHNLDLRVIIERGGKFSDFTGDWGENFAAQNVNLDGLEIVNFKREDFANHLIFKKNYDELVANKTIKQAKEAIIEALKNTPSKTGSLTPSSCSSQGHEDKDGVRDPVLQSNSVLCKQEKITRAVKCAERSGVPIEILVVPQWFIKILDKKELLKEKASNCNWYPEYMKVRINQWIDGLAWDWCISRQRFFGVKFPVWYSKRKGEEGKILVADISQLPVDPTIDLPEGPDGKYYSRDEVIAETDIMDTWATSSISPQLSSHGISDDTDLGENDRHQKLFPADLRPQAHEIIRTWAFYTIVKSVFHSLPMPEEIRGNDESQCSKAAQRIDTYVSSADKLQQSQNSNYKGIPWKNLMISGWCLASDKTKMSKSKGNVVTPTALIEEKGSDIVRYWASTSHLGADTAYSEDVFKIGQKLITKLFNASKFASMNFDMLDKNFARDNSKKIILGKTGSLNPSLCSDQKHENKDGFRDPVLQGDSVGGKNNSVITESSDLWILARLQQTIAKATLEFEQFEYARAREAIEQFFWHDFCDNYLEICKVRSYGIEAQKLEGIKLNQEQKQQVITKQQSSILTLKICLENLLKLFAPILPHLCDEIYATIFEQEFLKNGSINSRGNWPKIDKNFVNEELIKIGDELLEVIFEVRKFKSEQNISMKNTVSKILINCQNDLSKFSEDLENVCNALEIEFVKDGKFVEIIL